MIPLILVTLLACGETGDGKVAAPPPPEFTSKQEAAPAAGKEKMSSVDFMNLLMTAPGGDGPTEIRQGNKLVGFVFRPQSVQGAQTYTEYVYMANGAVALAPKVQTDPVAGGVAPYPVQLSPHEGAFGASYDSAVSVVHRSLQVCTDTNCTSLAQVPATTWQGWAAGQHVQAMQAILDDRFGTPPTIANFTTVIGTITLWAPFDLVQCRGAFSSTNGNQVHADKAAMVLRGTGGSTTHNVWQFTERIASALPRKAVVVVQLQPASIPAEVGVDTVNDQPDPPGPPGQILGREWCGQMNDNCRAASGGAPTCAMATITFTAP